MPYSTKRVREDEERVYYSIVVPGFSALAVTGGRDLPPQNFSVSDLTIVPRAPASGEPATISARVTNTSAKEAVYPGNLWINDTIETTETLLLPGETRTLSFTIASGESGAYKVRVERLLDEFTVGPAPVATGTAGPSASPTRTPVVSPTATREPGAATPVVVAATGTATPTPSPVAPTLTSSVPTAQATPGSATPTPTVTSTGTPTPIGVAQAATATPATEGPAPTLESLTATPVPAAPEAPGGGLSIGVIVGVVAGVVVVAAGAGVFIYVRRRR